MPTLTAHHLEFTLEALTPVELNEHQGAALRGALYQGLRRFCAQPRLESCAGCIVLEACPVAALVATMDPQSERGRDRPRPYAVEPPLDGATRLEPGETLTFGLTLFARALQLFPYVVQGLRSLQELGLGKRLPGLDGRRGRMRLREAMTVNPLSGERRPVMAPGTQLVQVPDIPVTQAQVEQAALGWPAGPVAISFLTPTRLVARGQLLKAPEFGPFFHRLWQRLADLASEFAGAPIDRDEGYQLVGMAREVRLIADETRWVELESYSTRLRRTSPISGFVGRAVYEGDLAPFLPWLIWGQLAHVGKDAVKGNGWYAIEARCT